LDNPTVHATGIPLLRQILGGNNLEWLRKNAPETYAQPIDKSPTAGFFSAAVIIPGGTAKFQDANGPEGIQSGRVGQLTLSNI